MDAGSRAQAAREALAAAEAAAGIRLGRSTVLRDDVPLEKDKPNLRAARTTVDGSRTAANGSRTTANGSRTTVDEARTAADGPRITVDRVGATVDGPHATASWPRRGPHTGARPSDPATAGSEPDPHDIARLIVLRQLGYGPRTRVQLERKLAAKGCDPEVSAVVLDRMTEVGLVDDAAYAEQLVSAKRRGRGLARSALARELRRTGIADDLVDGALSGIGHADEEETARSLVDKRLRTLSGLDPTVQARRLSAMLARKGFSPSVIYPVIRDAIAEAPEHQRD